MRTAIPKLPVRHPFCARTRVFSVPHPLCNSPSQFCTSHQNAPPRTTATPDDAQTAPNNTRRPPDARPEQHDPSQTPAPHPLSNSSNPPAGITSTQRTHSATHHSAQHCCSARDSQQKTRNASADTRASTRTQTAAPNHSVSPRRGPANHCTALHSHCPAREGNTGHQSTACADWDTPHRRCPVATATHERRQERRGDWEEPHRRCPFTAYSYTCTAATSPRPATPPHREHPARHVAVPAASPRATASPHPAAKPCRVGRLINPTGSPRPRREHHAPPHRVRRRIATSNCCGRRAPSQRRPAPPRLLCRRTATHWRLATPRRLAASPHVSTHPDTHRRIACVPRAPRPPPLSRRLCRGTATARRTAARSPVSERLCPNASYPVYHQISLETHVRTCSPPLTVKGTAYTYSSTRAYFTDNH